MSTTRRLGDSATRRARRLAVVLALVGCTTPTRTAPSLPPASDSAAIVVDVSFATDHPNIEKKEIGDHRIGGGPILSRGAVISPVVFSLLRTVADRQSIPYSVHAAGRDTSTNADAIHIAREGVATGLVSIPNRYMHSPNELVSLEDVDRTATLLAETCREINDKTDFRAR